jgi:hypothetical protein
MERRDSVPVSRKTFLMGMAGVAVAGTRGLRASRSPIRGAIPASSAHPRSSQLPSVTVNLSDLTGITIPSYIYGYATGALLDNKCQLAANSAVKKSAGALAPSLVRFNTPASNIIQTVFVNGVSQPNWAAFAKWVKNRASFLGDSSQLVFGIGPAPDPGVQPLPADTWAQYAKATAQHFRNIGQEITYWEVGNECDQSMDVATYSQYFNAIAGALHSVNDTYLVGGPVSSWWGAMDLPTFVGNCGSEIGFIDFHSYPVNDSDSTQTAYQKAAAFNDVASARQALVQAGAPSLPIALLEYNMNSGMNSDGTFGLPAQGTIVGAVYTALLLTQAAASDTNFTMAGIWDLVADSHYGVIGNIQDSYNFHDIDQQGRYLHQAAQLMPGQQATTSTTATGLQVLATTSGQSFSIHLVNYNLQTQVPVTINLQGAPPGSQITRWELSTRYPNGHTSLVTSLARVPLPPQSIVILSGNTTTARVA